MTRSARNRSRQRNTPPSRAAMSRFTMPYRSSRTRPRSLAVSSASTGSGASSSDGGAPLASIQLPGHPCATRRARARARRRSDTLGTSLRLRTLPASRKRCAAPVFRGSTPSATICPLQTASQKRALNASASRSEASMSCANVYLAAGSVNSEVIPVVAAAGGVSASSSSSKPNVTRSRPAPRQVSP